MTTASTARRTRAVLLPLDDRPVNTTLVTRLAELAGIELVLPDADLLGDRDGRRAREGLEEWLESAAEGAEVLIVSLNQLLYGGFVASRRTLRGIAESAAGLGVLGRIRRRRPDIRIEASFTLMRTKDRNDAGAEPDYWADYGVALAADSAGLYRAEHGEADADSFQDRSTSIPAEQLRDAYLRRMRLHAAQLAAIDSVAEGAIDRLAVLVEDSRTESVSTSEREWLQAWVVRLGLEDRVRCYPGADEFSAASLVGAALRTRAGEKVARVLCVDAEGMRRIAPFEDVPLLETLREQARTAGIRLSDDTVQEADFVLAVHAPVEGGADWFREAGGAGQRRDSAEEAPRLAAEIARALDAGAPVVVADVAFANGADPALVQALGDAGVLARLSGFAGWNTAGNSLGTALAIGGALALGPAPDPSAVSRLLAERLLEDWGYQSSVRPELTERTDGVIDAAQTGELESMLGERLRTLPVLGREWSISPGSARWPWGRLFEVAFELTKKEED